MKILQIFATCLIIFLLLPDTVAAIYKPTAFPNNIFGIHIADVNDIPAAAELVNSANDKAADWGYVTLVIEDDDRELKKWSNIFQQLHDYHLIPIVRLATRVKNGTWLAPQKNGIDDWVNFLDQLPWPIENRYVVLFNETNHAKEWGGTVNPAEYAKLTEKIISSLKSRNQAFFILPAGLDLYAPNSSTTMDATRYWQEMEVAVPGILSRFDGWTSHSYPAKNFSDSPDETGRHSIVGYRWELEYLSTHFGIESNLPVFITETGWMESKILSREKISEYFTKAFEEIWKRDQQVVAVTPFLLNYQNGLFDKFSWKKKGSDEFFPQYHAVRQLGKVLGKPIVIPTTGFGLLLAQDQEKQLFHL